MQQTPRLVSPSPAMREREGPGPKGWEGEGLKDKSWVSPSPDRRCATATLSRIAGEGLAMSYAANACRAAPRIIAAPFSAIMMVGALVLVEVTDGMTEA